MHRSIQLLLNLISELVQLQVVNCTQSSEVCGLLYTVLSYRLCCFFNLLQNFLIVCRATSIIKTFKNELQRTYLFSIANYVICGIKNQCICSILFSPMSSTIEGIHKPLNLNFAGFRSRRGCLWFPIKLKQMKSNNRN